MKRIFADCHVFDGKYQGTRTYIEGLYKELIAKGDHHFYLASSDPAHLEKVFGSHQNVTYLKYRFKGGMMRLLLDAPRLILKNKIDAAHFQYRVPPLKFCRYIVTTHDVLFEDFPEYFSRSDRFMSYWTYRLSAKYSDVVLTVSEYSRQKIKEHLGVDNVFITPNGVAEKFFEEYDQEEIKKEVFQRFGFQDHILYTSRWEPRKNQHLLLRAFVEAGLYTTRHLVFIGGKTFENKAYDDYYNNLSPEIQKKVINKGVVNNDDALLLLRGAALFVYPSVAEGFGIPPLEAIAANVPTISSNRTSMADFDFIGDHFFDPDNCQELKNKMIMALQHANNGSRQQKQLAVKARYTWKQCAIAFTKAIQGKI